MANKSSETTILESEIEELERQIKTLDQRFAELEHDNIYYRAALESIRDIAIGKVGK